MNEKTLNILLIIVAGVAAWAAAELLALALAANF